ncbi:hypothetical protein ACEW7V_01850 [Areca yellow leaf disease phytoplasma]
MKKHIIGDGVEEIQDTKNQIFASSAILPTKVFLLLLLMMLQNNIIL